MNPIQYRDNVSSVMMKVNKLVRAKDAEIAKLANEIITLTGKLFGEESKEVDLLKREFQILDTIDKRKAVTKKVNDVFNTYIKQVDSDAVVRERKQKEEENKEIRTLQSSVGFVSDSTVIPAENSAMIAITKMSQIQGIIERSGIDPKDIVVIFDFDWTLCEKLKGMPPPGQRAERLRGGDDTKQFVDFLKANKVNAGIITAGSIPKALLGLKYILGEKEAKELAFMQSFRCEGIADGSLDSSNLPIQRSKTKEGIDVQQLHGILSSPTSSYDKPACLEYLLNKNNIAPKLVIFIDDSANNVREMFTHYNKGNTPIISAYFPVLESDIKADSYHEFEPAERDTLVSLQEQWWKPESGVRSQESEVKNQG